MEKIVDVELSALIGPADCGGPFDLWEPNSTFNSPNYPQSYGNKAKCEYTLNFCSFGVRDSSNSRHKIGRRCDWPRSCAFLNACAFWLYNYSELLSLQVCGPSTPQKDKTFGCTSWILTWKPPTTWWRCGMGRGQTPRCWVRILVFLHFFPLMVEVDHSFASSPAVLTGSQGPARDLYSTTSEMAVWFFTDSSGSGRGFRANFTSGVNLGSPGTGTGTLSEL